MEAIPFSELILFAIILAQAVINEINKRRAEDREGKLIKAIMAQNLPEYTASLETPKSRIQHMKAESNLAEKATVLEREMSKTDLDNYPAGSIPVR